MSRDGNGGSRRRDFYSIRNAYSGGRMERSVSGGGSGGVKEQMLPDLKKGDHLRDFSCSLKEGKTKPPARFTEAALLSAMENPVKYMESGDRGLAKTLGETGGLGTVATRADIMRSFFPVFFWKKRVRRFI